MQNNSFMLSKADSKRFCIAIGIGAFTLALVEFLNPTTQPPTGRWDWLFAPIFNNFGSLGLSIYWVIVGIVLVFIGLGKSE
jgi:hypothetical protein